MDIDLGAYLGVLFFGSGLTIYPSLSYWSNTLSEKCAALQTHYSIPPELLATLRN